MKLGLYCFQLKDDLFCAVNREFVAYRTLHSQKSLDCPVDVDALFAHWLTAKLGGSTTLSVTDDCPGPVDDNSKRYRLCPVPDIANLKSRLALNLRRPGGALRVATIDHAGGEAVRREREEDWS
jgi:hypothetical protein